VHKPHPNFGGYILVKKSAAYTRTNTVLFPEKQELLRIISLSANTVVDHVNDLAGVLQCQLKKNVKILWHI
jgi:hypothetical protein